MPIHDTTREHMPKLIAKRGVWGCDEMVVKIFEHLDLNRPGLATVRAPVARADVAAAAALLDYYRKRQRPVYPARAVAGVVVPAPAALMAEAEATLRHIFLPRADMRDHLGHPPHDYGADINWDADPVQDHNWVACMHRFTWDHSIASAYLTTGDDRFVRGWCALVADWIAKNPLVPKAFGYGPLQVGVRSWRWCAGFDLFLDSPAFTPDFLLVFLNGVRDQALKTWRHATPTHHNQTIAEADGLMRLAIMFPEFKEAGAWFEAAAALLDDTVSRQVSEEGVQREWSINYHIACAGLISGAVELARNNGRDLPQRLTGAVEKMYDYLFAAMSPDRLYPMFGDPRRPAHAIEAGLRRGAALFGKPHHLAVLENRAAACPQQLSYAFPKSGMYFLRSGWSRDSIYLALHCSPPAASSHDHWDNGTFELYAHGRWLMPDSGCYAYGGKPFAAERPWFSSTVAHQTLTLDGKNSVNAARHLLWHSEPAFDVVAFENASYERLTHRRTVWFVNRSFFVLLDEALGDAAGQIDLHFQLAPGPWVFDPAAKTAHTTDNKTEPSDALPSGAIVAPAPGVLVWSPTDAPAEMIEERGQVSFQFHVKQPRPAFAYRQTRGAPAWFWTVIAPFRTGGPPVVHLKVGNGFQPGANRAEAVVTVAGQSVAFGRDLAKGTAWCTPSQHDESATRR